MARGFKGSLYRKRGQGTDYSFCIMVHNCVRKIRRMDMNDVSKRIRNFEMGFYMGIQEDAAGELQQSGKEGEGECIGLG